MSQTSAFTIKKMSPQLLVSDIDHALEFYTQKLGFDIDFRYQDFYASIFKDGYSIHLKSGSPILKVSSDENVNLDIVFVVEQIEGLHKDFLNKSVEMIQPLRQMPYGKEFYIADLDGNVLAFVEGE